VWTVVGTDQEEQDADHGADGGHDITGHISHHVLHLQRRLLAILPAVNHYSSWHAELLQTRSRQLRKVQRYRIIQTSPRYGDIYVVGQSDLIILILKWV